MRQDSLRSWKRKLMQEMHETGCALVRHLEELHLVHLQLKRLPRLQALWFAGSSAQAAQLAFNFAQAMHRSASAGLRCSSCARELVGMRHHATQAPREILAV